MKLNVQTKLLSAFGLFVVLMLGIFGAGFWGMNTIATHTDEIVLKDFPEDIAVRELEILVLEQTATYEDFIITKDPHDLEKIEHEIEAVVEHFTFLEHEFEGNAELTEMLREIEGEYDKFVEAGEVLISLVSNNASHEEIVSELKIVQHEELLLEEELVALAHRVEENVEHAYHEALAAKSMATNIALAALILSAIAATSIGFYIARAISNGVKSVSAAADDIATSVLPQLVTVTESVANGDLTKSYKVDIKNVEIASKDEIGELGNSFNKMGQQLSRLGNANETMVTSLRGIVEQVANTASDVSMASEQLASSSEQAGSATQNIAEQTQGLSTGAMNQGRAVSDTADSLAQLGSAIEQIAQGAQTQSESVDTTSIAITEVSRAITEVAKNAQQAAESTQTADTAARDGLGIVEQTVTGMNRIKVAVEDVTKRIGELGAQSAEIGKIVSVIDDIAAQTNLLALNAAIEAARAGEQGRGFAVVADEVRQLAERVTQATSEIAGLIDGVQKGVEDSVTATQKGTTEVEEGTQLADQAGKSLNRIQEAVADVTLQVEMISSASEEVSASSDEMVRSIESVTAVTEQTTAGTEQMAASNDQVQQSMDSISAITTESGTAVEETSAATEELSAQVEEVVASASALGEMASTLKTTVDQFKLDDGEEELAA